MTDAAAAGQPRAEPRADPRVVDACVRAALEYIENHKATFPRANAHAERIRRLEDERGLVEATRSAARNAVRRAVTGDEATRVRDHVAREAHRIKTTPAVVKTVDKVLFTGCVGWILATEYVVLARPPLVGLWYAATLLPLLAYRVVTYRKQGWGYFCLDFCYFLNFACVALVLLEAARVPVAPVYFETAFALCNGPLLAAVLAWRNSFVFHSLDHATSTALHCLPPLWTFATRWADGGAAFDRRPALGAWYCSPILAYCVWQLLYVVKTEVLDAEYLEKTPDEQTALRWLTRDERNGMHRICKFVCVRTGAMARGEAFDPETAKTKATFWVGQLAYTVATLVGTPLLWRHRELHAACLALTYTSAVYNGASYYVEVFSKRYNNKFE